MANTEPINASQRNTPDTTTNPEHNESASSQIETGLERAIPRSMDITQGDVHPLFQDTGDDDDWEDDDEDDSDLSYDSEINPPLVGVMPHAHLSDNPFLHPEHNPEMYYDDGLDEFYSSDEWLDDPFDPPESLPEEMFQEWYRDLAAAIHGDRGLGRDGGNVCSCGGHHPGDSEYDSEDDSLPSMMSETDLGYDSETFQSEKGDGLDSFPQFMRLPPELRASIWEMYAPELTMRAQLLDFQIRRRPERLGSLEFKPDDFTVCDGISLPHATHRIRKILAVHRESRNTVLGRFPDTLSFGWKNKSEDTSSTSDKGLIRFSKERDVVLFGGYNMWDPKWEGQPTPMHMPGFAENIQNAAFHIVGKLRDDELKDVTMILDNLPNLKNVFYCHLCRAFSLKDMRWLAAPSTRERMVRHRGNGVVHAELFCWPDPNTPSDYTITPRLKRVVENLQPRATEAGWNVLPMLGFNGHTHLALREEAIETANRLAHKEKGGDSKDEDGSDSDGDDSVLDIDDGMDFMFDDDMDDAYHHPFGDHTMDEGFSGNMLLDTMMYGEPAIDEDFYDEMYEQELGWPMP